MTGDLDHRWSELRERIYDSFTLFEAGSVDWGKGPIVRWPDPDDVDGFLEVAAAAGARLVYAHARELDEPALGALEATVVRHGEPHPGMAGVLVEGEIFLGRTATVEIGWVVDGMSHVLVLEAEWYRRMREEIRELAVVRSLGVEARRLLLSQRLERVPEWAEQVAREEDFHRTRSFAEREEIVCRFVPELGAARDAEEPGAWTAIAEVAREAWRIFEEEIRPRQERDMAQIAHSLLMSGLKKYEVAGRMGVSKEKLNTLIARYPEPDS
ncbi:MAG TPA: hypothetical protein VHN37_11100 [Actinomycetota bacterium]|nr:hypothetical protein [Actinomycetota bacterium]